MILERWPSTIRLAVDGGQPTPLNMPELVREAIVEHMLRCFPFEGVGLLATSMKSRALFANRFYPGRNVDASPQRYTMDPADVLAATHDMERRSLRLLAIVHSHPYTPPVPSASDLAEASLPGVLSLIVRLTPAVELRAWQIVFRRDGIAVRGQEVPIRELAGPQHKPANSRFLSGDQYACWTSEE